MKVSQLSLLLVLVMTGGKFLSLPAILAKDLGHDSWLVVLLNFAFDFVCLCFLLWAIKINKNKLGFDEILSKTLSPLGSTVVLAVFFVMFMVRVIILLESCYNTFAIIFDVNTNWILFVLPIILVTAFAILRGFKSVARLGQILFAFVIFSIVAITIYPLTIMQPSALLPIAEAGWGKILSVTVLRCYWFSDYLFIYFVLEEIQPQKRLFTPMLVSFAVGVVLTLTLNVVFIALFGSLAQYNNVAMIKIGIFSASATTDGRWDWITLTVWITSVVIKIVIFIFCAYKCVEKMFRLHFTKVNVWVMGAITLIAMVPMFVSIDVFLEKFANYCIVPFAVLQYLLPLFMPLITKVASKKAQEQSLGWRKDLEAQRE